MEADLISVDEGVPPEAEAAIQSPEARRNAAVSAADKSAEFQ